MTRQSASARPCHTPQLHRRSRLGRAAGAAFGPGLVERLEERVLWSTYAVTTTADAGPGSLRQAILDANASPGADAITFNLPGNAPFVIAPASPLPAVTDAVSIDGTTQGGFDPATHAPVVVLDGSAAGPLASGLTITGGADRSTTGSAADIANNQPLADDSVVRGLEVVRFSGSGILLDGASHCVVAGNYVGTDGSRALGNGSPGGSPDPLGGGITLGNGASFNQIGGATAADRNVVSANSVGVYLFGPADQHNSIQGNYIGTDATGNQPLGNTAAGVEIEDGPAASQPAAGQPAGTQNVSLGNTIGGTNPGEGNVISANGTTPGHPANRPAGPNVAWGGAPGVYLLARDNGDSGAGSAIADTVVEGNFIGTNAAGDAILGNAGAGIDVGGAVSAVIGGTTPAARNLISGNGGPGVNFVNTSGTTVTGNFIGTDATGKAPLPNAVDGVCIGWMARGLTVGDADPAAANVIAFNGGDGIRVEPPDPSFQDSPNRILSNSVFSNGGVNIDYVVATPAPLSGPTATPLPESPPTPTPAPTLPPTQTLTPPSNPTPAPTPTPAPAPTSGTSATPDVPTATAQVAADRAALASDRKNAAAALADDKASAAATASADKASLSADLAQIQADRHSAPALAADKAAYAADRRTAGAHAAAARALLKAHRATWASRLKADLAQLKAHLRQLHQTVKAMRGGDA